MTENETTISMEQFIADRGITMRAVQIDYEPKAHEDQDWMLRADHWRCTFSRTVDGKRRQMTAIFHMGSGHNGKEPSAADVLDSLASDSDSVNSATSFEDWADSLGYNPDSRKDFRIYRACERAAARLLKFLGDTDYETALYSTERQ